MLRHANLFSKIRLPPGAALAYHRHDGETEYCVFMSETGVVADDVRERMSAPGDVTVTGSCCPHSLANESGEDLLLYAMIIVD
jgi:mannose-6-phosphate isomerase-like protein (cupin superfamily)